MLGIRAFSIVLASIGLLVPRAAAVDLVPYRSSDYRYQIVASGGLAGFEATGFDDSGFAIGNAAFGSGGCAPWPASTHWQPNSDLLVRRAIVLPEGATGLQVGVSIDNDVQVFLNGMDISGGIRHSDGCPVVDRFVFHAPDNLIQQGTNIVAVRAIDRGGSSFFDMRIAVTDPGDAPDLEVTSLVVPLAGQTARAGHGFELSWSVTNLGTGPTPGLWVDHVYLSPDPVFGNGNDILVGETGPPFIDQLPPGGSYTWNRYDDNYNSAFDLPLEAGDYWVIVVTNAANTFPEPSVNNNVLVSEQPIHVVVAPPDGCTWSLRAIEGPTYRNDVHLAFDPVTDRTVVFGGHFANGGGRRGDTWEWDGEAWALRSESGPSARADHALAYDANRGRILLFGGNQGVHWEPDLRGDTWEWDGTHWAEVHAPGPSPRRGHAMCFDSIRGRMVVFGGLAEGGVKLGDTWEFDGTTWTQAHVPGPSPRDSHQMAFDSDRGRVVLFGGSGDSHIPHGDTWEWDGASWALVSESGPPGRVGHAMAYDPGRGRTLLHGGGQYAGWVPSYLWEWDGVEWSRGTELGPRIVGHGMAFDTRRGRMVVHNGGRTTPGTWEISSPAWVSSGPVATTVPAGELVTFSVEATGCGPLTYRWRKDGHLLFDGARISGAATPTLSIAGAQVSDSGEYDMVVASEAGSLTSESATLVVTPPPLLPDLVITHLSAPAAAQAGSTIDVTWTGRNFGGATAAGPWADRVYISTNPTYEEGIDQPVSPEVLITGALEPGGAYQRTVPVSLPETPGQYWLIVRADDTDVVPEMSEDNNTHVSVEPIILAPPPRPDLRVSEVTPPPNAPPGTVVQLAYTIENIGDGAAAAPWREIAWGSLDPFIGNDIEVGRFDATAPLAPGESVQRIINVTVPNVAPGGYWVIVCVDTENVVIESDESNNCTAAPTCVDCLSPDLQVVAVAAPSEGVAGAPLNISWRVRNTGQAPANGSWIDRVLLVRDVEPVAQLVLAEVQRTGPLSHQPPSNEYERTLAVNVPLETEGPWRITIVTDATNTVPESGGEGNNVLAADPTVFTLPPGPDLVVTAVVPSQGETPIFGQPLSVSWTVQNQGNLPAQGGWTDRLFLSRDPQLSGDDVPLQPVGPLSGPLAVGDSYTAQQTVTLPLAASLEAGTYYILVHTDSGNVVAEQRESNNVSASKAIQVQRPSLPDLQVVSVAAPAGGIPGEQVELVWTVINAGEAPTTVGGTAWIERIYISADDQLGGDTAIAAIQVNQPLQPGESVTRVYPITVPNLGLGYHAVVCVNATNTILETDLTNNCGIAPSQSPVFRPDLEVVDVAGPSTALADGPLEVTWTIRNAGPAPTYSTFIDTISLVEDGPGGQVRLVGSYFHSTSFAPGEAREMTRNFTVPGRLRGNYRIRVRTDSAGSLIEGGAGEANNSRDSISPTSIDQPPRPDLVVATVNRPADGLVSSPGTVSWTVENLSSTAPAAGPWIDRIVALPVEPPGPEVQLALVVRAQALQPLESYSASAPVTLPASAGAYRIVVTTDSGDVVNEGLDGGEDNNTYEDPSLFFTDGYFVSAVPNISSGLAGDAVHVSGAALRIGDPTPLPDVPVSVALDVRGTVRTFNTRTSETGTYQIPLPLVPTEAGNYTLRAGPPNAINPDPQSQFVLLGLSSPRSVTNLRVFPGGAPLTGQFAVMNTGDTPLTDLGVSISGAPEGVDVQVNVGHGALLGQQSRAVQYTITAFAGTPNADAAIVLAFTAAGGASARTELSLRVQPPSARLEAHPASLNAGMLRALPGKPGKGDDDRQTNVQFTLRNTGGSPTGPIQVRIPSTPWMTLATPASLPSLSPDATATVVLTLAPSSTLPLGPYTGTIVLEGTATSLVVPFRFVNTSDGVGDLIVLAEDEFTYYAPGNPPLAGAEVRVIDPLTNQTVISGLTGATGEATFSALAEGTYNIEVRAERRAVHRGLASVFRGEETFHAAFLPRQVVTYSWRVDPEAIDDRYRFVLDTVFETNVPIPQLVIDPPFVDLETLQFQTTQINFHVTNHGLIRANGVRAIFQGDGTFEVTPLVEDIGDIEAGQTVTVPVIFRDLRRGGSDGPCSFNVAGWFEHFLDCDTRRYYRERLTFRLPDVFCPGGGSPGGGPGGPGEPGSPQRPHVNGPTPPAESPPCGCYEVAVVFFSGAYTSSDFNLAFENKVTQLQTAFGNRVAARNFPGAICPSSRRAEAERWVRRLNDPSCPCGPIPRVIMVGHSYGADVLHGASNIPNVVHSITIDPINRAVTLPWLGNIICGGLVPWPNGCNGPWDQSDCEVIGPVAVTINIRASQAGGCNQEPPELPLLGYRIPGAINVPRPGDHCSILGDSYWVDAVDQAVELNLGCN